jgi:V-type H+-transporting ATPase subunit C
LFYSSGSLLSRNLNDVLKKEHFVLGSEYLKTLLVCVPKALINDWYAKYETLCAMIVPRTTELITQDQDYALFNVTLFQKTEDTFRHKCRENKYVEFWKRTREFDLYLKIYCTRFYI